MIDALARLPAGAPAIVDDRGALSAAELRDKIAGERAWLRATDSERFALLADNGRGWAITDLALLAGGRVNVPLPHHFGAGQLAHALDSAGVGAVLTDAPGRILDLALGFSRAGESPGTGLALLTRRAPDPGECPLPAGTLKVTYTSGSTAEPKGVCLSRAALEAVAASAAAIAAGLRIRRHLALLPLATLLENVAGMYAAWLAGATCYLTPVVPAAIARGSLTPGQLVEEVSWRQSESLILVPELLRILVDAAESGWKAPLTGRFFAVGGARVSPQLLERAARCGMPVYEGYGLSECASVVCLNTPAAARRGSVGRPLPHARVRIDARGEIHVAGALMGGYAGAHDDAPVEFATGDLGELDDDGFVYVRGRIKNMFINSFGRNLSPEWIESELSQESGIGQAVVFGEAQPRVVALLAPAHAGVPAAAIAESVASANRRLPPYARVARYHVLKERLSATGGLLTANGRPRRQQILERYANTIERLQAETDHVPV